MRSWKGWPTSSNGSSAKKSICRRISIGPAHGCITIWDCKLISIRHCSLSAEWSGGARQVIEQLDNNRLIRPLSRYIGPAARNSGAAGIAVVELAGFSGINVPRSRFYAILKFSPLPFDKRLDATDGFMSPTDRRALAKNGLSILSRSCSIPERSAAMEFNRNQFMMIGVVLLLLGLQFRLFDSCTLNPKTTAFLANRFQESSSATPSLFSTDTPAIRKVIRPPAC